MTPRHILILCERTYHGPRLPVQDGDVIPLKPDGVSFCNSLQVHHARRRLYCPKDKFDLVRQFAQMAPEAFDINRSRFPAGGSSE